jgi:hypothetical protein
MVVKWLQIDILEVETRAMHAWVLGGGSLGLSFRLSLSKGLGRASFGLGSDGSDEAACSRKDDELQ